MAGRDFPALPISFPSDNSSRMLRLFVLLLSISVVSRGSSCLHCADSRVPATQYCNHVVGDNPGPQS